MKIATIAAFTLIIFAFSCKKGSTPSASNEVYMNLTAGNTWTYEITNNLTAGVTSNTFTSTNRDSSISGKNYHVFTNSNAAPNEYYNITGSDYYTFRNLIALANAAFANIYLKSTVAAGASWSQTENITVNIGVPTTIPLTITHTIVAKDLSRTVSGKTYTSVIQTTTTITSTSLPAGALTTDIKSYYAPKYGLIESKNKITTTLVTGSNTDQTSILKSTNF
jgi:hypothetical protein